ncbi:MAG: hypothetical protein IPH18_13200 [Chitinophagaceae bacterium]|nr:hypothetical protein [Chitinophagaceae bacterium]
MMNRRTKKFWRLVAKLFLIYIILVPAVFLIFDYKTVSAKFNDDAWSIIIKMSGIALSIALIISLWMSRDPEMKEW